MSNNIDISHQGIFDNELANIRNYIPAEKDMGKRVLCLYRVSTDKQVTYSDNHEADIPMQRQKCRRFLEQQGWVLVHEEREDGVSGHKVRAEKRDSIQNIKELALMKKFDILLVFMFDRIGRIADETPFVVEWLIKNGIRVWSLNEGEQRMDSHTDKLMNYIRFWQADGESEKTSIRTKAGMGLLVESGHFKGGTAPYGYDLVKSGRIDKKGNEKKNLAVNEEEAVVVRKIFDLYVKHGYGCRRIARALTAEGIKTRAGKGFTQTSINQIVHNLTYTGILRSGESRSGVIENLQIIPQDVYKQAQDIMSKRVSDAADARTYPYSTDSRCLLNGKVYCASCGSRLIIATTDRYVYVNGEKMRKIRYTCYKRTLPEKKCNGQTGYATEKLDRVVDGVVRELFAHMAGIPKDEVINSGVAAMQQELESLYKVAERDRAKAMADLTELKGEVLKAIRGESKFSPDLLNELIMEAERKVVDTEKTMASAKRELDGCKERVEKMRDKYDEIVSWTELYDAADLSAKKMIVANLINRIEVGADKTGYVLHIDFNIDLKQFGINRDFGVFRESSTA